MRVPRIYHEGELVLNAQVVLSKDVSHHLINVLKRRLEDPLEVFNGSGQSFLANIVDINGKKAVCVHLLKNIASNTESSLSIELGIGLIKPDKMDLSIQKAVELGVSSIVPIVTKRCNINLVGSRLDKKLKHWQGIIISSCSQSGRVKLPKLSTPVKFSSWASELDGYFGIYFSPKCKNKLKNISSMGKTIKILIGPEGGLMDEEMEALAKYNWHGVSLGPRILRSETAVISALTIVQSIQGDM
ncbi:MAG: 16S rRNA (uracil(1498)-N(3))-methyltransferase [Legionellales bacterium]|nr:16S rRNA (uracil(1498)-N(3))-methyltransferase [Legionellales bacterium]